MTIEATLYSVLSTDAGVTALVGTDIYNLRVPEEIDAPFVWFQVITGQPYNVLNGRPKIERKLIQINCIGATPDQALAVSAAVRTALELEHGYLNGESSDYHEDTQEFRVRLDWALHG